MPKRPPRRRTCHTAVSLHCTAPARTVRISCMTVHDYATEPGRPRPGNRRGNPPALLCSSSRAAPSHTVIWRLGQSIAPPPRWGGPPVLRNTFIRTTPPPKTYAVRHPHMVGCVLTHHPQIGRRVATTGRQTLRATATDKEGAPRRTLRYFTPCVSAISPGGHSSRGLASAASLCFSIKCFTTVSDIASLGVKERPSLQTVIAWSYSPFSARSLAR